MSESCLKIYTHLSADPLIIAYLVEQHVQTLVYACMSAYKDSATIQTLACAFLSNLSAEWRSQDGGGGGGKCPVREAGVDLIARALVAHDADVKLLRHGLRTILNVLHGHERLSKRPPESAGSYVSRQSHQMASEHF